MLTTTTNSSIRRINPSPVSELQPATQRRRMNGHTITIPARVIWPTPLDYELSSPGSELARLPKTPPTRLRDFFKRPSKREFRAVSANLNWHRPESPHKLRMEDPSWLDTQEYIEGVIKYTFNSPVLLREAMWPIQKGWAYITEAPSATGTEGFAIRKFDEGNRKLAIVGDTVLKTVLLDTWFWEVEVIGSLHKRIQENITNKKLKEVAAKKGIDLYVEDCFVERIVMGKEVEATTVEAIIGAVWYDSHEDLATIRTLLDRLLDTNLVMEHQAFTSIAGRI